MKCRYKPPPEVGVQRVAGVVVDGRRPGSQEGINGMQVGLFVSEPRGVYMFRLCGIELYAYGLWDCVIEHQLSSWAGHYDVAFACQV